MNREKLPNRKKIKERQQEHASTNILLYIKMARKTKQKQVAAGVSE